MSRPVRNKRPSQTVDGGGHYPVGRTMSGQIDPTIVILEAGSEAGARPFAEREPFGSGGLTPANPHPFSYGHVP